MMETMVQSMTHIMKQQQVQMEQTTNTSGALSVAKPGTYQGERQSALIDGWIRSMERYFECHATSDARKILFASSLLRGPADIWWRSVERLPEDRHITTWEDFKTNLENRFRHKNAHREARDRLATITHTTSVQTYIDEVHMVHLELPDITEDELMDKFIRGLQPDVKAHVLGHDPIWLSQAEHQALVYENAYRGTTTLPPARLQDYNGPQPMDLGYASARPQQQRGGYNNAPRDGYNNSQRRGQDNGHRRNNGGRNTREITCFLCDERGHMVKDCPLKKHLKGLARSD